MEIVSAYSAKNRVRISFPDKGRAKQSMADECDINNIMARYQTTGALTHVRDHAGDYGFASSIDFTEAMQIVAKGNSMFEELPSSIRSKFKNDPARFLEFVQDEGNEDEMRELGLLPQAEDDAEASSEEPEGDQEGESTDDTGST